MKRPVREFYAIGEVCDLFGIKPHVLRYWETQFAALKPPKNRSGNRVYRQRDLELIALIQHLVHEERYTLEGARARIDELRQEGGAAEIASRALEQSFVRSLRGELEELLEILTPPSA
jgi:DNA-binding transcriptional MerR regulator